jgi:hypothetical protein
VPGAIASYRRALDAAPEDLEARQSLAELLTHRPDHWDEALERHRDLLDRDPVRLPSLRALLRIARGRDRERAVATGLAVLRALGAATPEERREAAAVPPLPSDPQAQLEDPDAECVRQLAQAGAAEIAEALGVGAEAAPTSKSGKSGDPVTRFRAAVIGAEGNLSAPALVPLSTEELGATLVLAAQLATEAGSVNGDGNLVNALSASLGRRTRRRLRKLLPDEAPDAVERVDFADWRAELRGLASIDALRSSDADLRTAFLAWLPDDQDDDPRTIPPEADIRERVAACPEARALLRRLTRVWLAAI